MPVNHHGREADAGRVVDLGRRRTERVFALINLRDHLAAAHAAYEAHGFSDDALLMFQQTCQIESEIKALAPSVYRRSWSDWVERDALLIHGPDERSPRCSICKLKHAAELRPAS